MKIRQHSPLMTFFSRHEHLFRDIEFEQVMINVVDELGNHGKEDMLEIVESLDVVFREIHKLGQKLHSFPKISVEQILVVFFIAGIEVGGNIWERRRRSDIIVAGPRREAFVWWREGRGTRTIITVGRRGTSAM